jgi:hypothetical protein
MLEEIRQAEHAYKDQERPTKANSKAVVQRATREADMSMHIKTKRADATGATGAGSQAVLHLHLEKRRTTVQFDELGRVR